MQHPSPFVTTVLALLAAGGLLAGCNLTGAPPDVPALSVADARVPEGDRGTRTAAFQVTLSAATPRTVTVSYQTADGTPRTGAAYPQPSGAARAVADYRAASGVLTFAPGATTQTITVTVLGDTVNELDETFTVTLGDAAATGTIVGESGDDGDPAAAGSLFRDHCPAADAACPLLVVVPAGTFMTPFHTGAALGAEQANYGAQQTQDVGSYAANAFGLHDAHGNAAELTAECYDAAGGACARRVVRGGSWDDQWPGVRSAYRSHCPPALRNAQNGFRVARRLDL